MRDASVKAKTGNDWAGWVRALDERGATSMRHRDIAAVVRAEWPAPRLALRRAKDREKAAWTARFEALGACLKR